MISFTIEPYIVGEIMKKMAVRLKFIGVLNKNM